MSDRGERDVGSDGGLEDLRGLETRIESEAPYFDPPDEVFRFSRFVCQILAPTSDGTSSRGTGFLVGPDLILTNFHVVEGVPADRLQCRFDVGRLERSDAAFGPTIDVLGVVATSPYSEAEGRGSYRYDSSDHPTADQLDFALLRLKSDIGKQSVEIHHEMRPERGWLELPEHSPDVEPDGIIHVLQHPGGGTLKAARGTIPKDQPGLPARLRYMASTERGSSGSPCFRWSRTAPSRLVLVAMHNYGDPEWPGGGVEFNHGISIDLVRRHIEATGADVEFQPWLSGSRRPPLLKQGIAISVGLIVLFGAAWLYRCPLGLDIWCTASEFEIGPPSTVNIRKLIASHPNRIGFIGLDTLTVKARVNNQLVDLAKDSQGADSTEWIAVEKGETFTIEVTWSSQSVDIASSTIEHRGLSRNSDVVIGPNDYNYEFDDDGDGFVNIQELDYNTGPSIKDSFPKITDLGLIASVSRSDTIGMSLLVIFDTSKFEIDISLKQPDGLVARAESVNDEISYIPGVGAVIEEAGCKGALTVHDLNVDADYNGEMIRYFGANSTLAPGLLHLRAKLRSYCTSYEDVSSSTNRFSVIANKYGSKIGDGVNVINISPEGAVLSSSEQYFDMEIEIRDD